MAPSKIKLDQYNQIPIVVGLCGFLGVCCGGRTDAMAIGNLTDSSSVFAPMIEIGGDVYEPDSTTLDPNELIAQFNETLQDSTTPLSPSDAQDLDPSDQPEDIDSDQVDSDPNNSNNIVESRPTETPSETLEPSSETEPTPSPPTPSFPDTPSLPDTPSTVDFSNSDCDDAVEIGSGKAAALANSSATDFYKLTVKQGQRWAIYTEANPDDFAFYIDTVVLLFDEKGEKLIAQNDDRKPRINRDSRLIFSAPKSGTYCVAIKEFSAWDYELSPVQHTQYDYEVFAEKISDDEEDTLHFEQSSDNDDSHDAQELTFSGQHHKQTLPSTRILGSFDSKNDRDWYKFEVDSDYKTLEIDDIDHRALEISLYTQSGDLVDTFDTATTGLYETLLISVQEDEYLIEVSLSENGEGTFEEEIPQLYDIVIGASL